jgi:hypothetical protein
MNHAEIESYFTSKEGTEQLLGAFETTFLDIMTIEDKLEKREIISSTEVRDALNIITTLENRCNGVYIVADTYKTGEETAVKNRLIQNAVKRNIKPNISQCKEEASGEVQYLRRVRNIFQMYKDRAMNIKSTLKASYYNNKEYETEDKG